MKKKGFFRRIMGKKTKTGASLMVVLIAVSMLIVMGSTFSMVALTAYNNSQRRLCQQQAYYTAEACLNILSSKFANDPNGSYMAEIQKKIREENDAHPGKYTNVSDIVVEIARLEDHEGNDGIVSIPTNGLEASLLGIMGGCVVRASAVEGTKTIDSISTVKLAATATYKGYEYTLTARMAMTTKGSLELKKIFSNSQCWQTPVVTLIAGQTKGDMYFLSPGKYERWSNGEIRMDDAIVPGKGVSYRTYNTNLRDNVYGNVSSGNTKVNKPVHTRPFDIDNLPMKSPAMRAVPVSMLKEEFWDRAVWAYDWDASSIKDSVKQKNKAAAREAKYTEIQNALNNGKYGEWVTKINAYAPSADMEYYPFYNNKAKEYAFGPKGEGKLVRKVQGHWIGILGADGWDDIESRSFNIQRPAWSQYDKRFYNDWTEIYMFTGDSGPNKSNIVNGDMYVNTRALVGLYDKDQIQLHYWPYLDYTTDQNKVERKFISYAGYQKTDGTYEDYYNRGAEVPFYEDIYTDGEMIGKDFEHGGEGGKLFFDYYEGAPAYNKSVLSHNGNMYLFDDARIECYDSTHTENANMGIKNNIFAHANLVIDGFALEQNIHDATQDRDASDNFTNKHDTTAANINYFKNHVPAKRNVNIYGDVMVEGELTIANATIYGDVYCNGDKLIIKDTDIYGNVYFNGSCFKSDNVNIRGDEKTATVNGKTVNYSFKTDKGFHSELKGGDLIIFGNDKDRENKPEVYYDYDGETAHDNDTYSQLSARIRADFDNMNMWGAVLTNTSVSRTLYSGINTKINPMYVNYNRDIFKDANGNNRRVSLEFKDITVDANLFMDLRETYRHDLYYADQNYFSALINNAIYVSGLCIAQRMMIKLTQSGDKQGDFVSKIKPYELQYMDNTKHRDGVIYYDYAWDRTTLEKQHADPWDKAETNPNSPFHRAVSVNIKTLNIGNGGILTDGNPWWFYYDGSDYEARENAGKNSHSGILIETLNVTTHSTYKEGEETRYNKIALWNTAGKLDGMKYVDVAVHAYNDAATPPKLQASHATLNKHSTESQEINTTISDIVKAIIENEYKARPDKDKGVQFNYAPEDKKVSNIISELGEYYTKNKAPHRVNKYYAYASQKMNYRGYKEIYDMSIWATNNQGVGPYPRFDDDAVDGVWRHINMLEWKAPQGVTPKNIKGTNMSYNTIFDKAEYDCYYTSAGVLTEGVVGNAKPIEDIPDYIKHDENGNMVVMGNIYSDKTLYVPVGKKLIFDTSRTNLHCTIKGGIILGKNAEVVLRGGGMTFLYMELNQQADPPAGTTWAPDSADRLILGMEENSVIGSKETSQDTKPNDSIYIVCNDNGLIQMKSKATVKGFVYVPKGYLKVDEFTYDNKGNVVYNNGTVHTILYGSLVVKSFLVDMTASYDQILGMYKNLRYEYVLAPLICDQNIDFGNTDEQIGEYQNPEWGFIGFD